MIGTLDRLSGYRDDLHNLDGLSGGLNNLHRCRSGLHNVDGLRLDLDVLGGECGSDGDGAGSGGLVDVQDDLHQRSAGRYLIRDGLFNDGYGTGTASFRW